LSFIGRLPKPTKALVVSRQRTHIPGRAIQIYLEVLTPIETWEYLRQYLGPKQRKEIDHDDALPKTLYEKTGGLPLALAFVTGLLNQGLSVTEVLAQLEESTSTGDIILGPLLKRLVSDLPEEQHRFLDALSAFIHSADGESIASVAEVKNWRKIGQALERLSVVQVVDGRYALHPLVRTYLRDQLAPDRLSSFQQRMVRYFLDYAKEFQSNFDQLDREWPNIEYSVETAYSDELWQEFVDFILILGQFLSTRGYERDYQRWLNLAIEVSYRLNNKSLTAALLHNLGVQYQRQNELSNALEAYQRSLLRESEIGDRLGEANTLAQLGTIYFQQGHIAQAEEVYQQALQISRELGDIRSESRCHLESCVTTSESSPWVP
jgi:tetratricopeptide (TPR) repeat protein